MANLVLGVDSGNKSLKIWGEFGSLVYSSGLVKVREIEGLLGKKDIDVITIKSMKFDEENKYYIGKDVLKMGDIIVTNIGEGRYKNKYFKIFVEGAIANAIKLSVEHPSEEKHKVKIVTGLPSREKSAKSIEEELIKALEGNHIVEVDGIEITFDVEVLKVVAQPLGTLFREILGNKRTELTEKYVGIIDCGGGTTDIDGIRELTVVDSDRDTFPIGSYEVHQRLADFINKENIYANANASKVEEQFNSNSYRISDRASVDISKVKEEITRGLSEELINKIAVRWQNLTKFDIILLTGGSSSIYGEGTKELIEDIEIVDNSQLANAEGFYLYALFLLEQ